MWLWPPKIIGQYCQVCQLSQLCKCSQVFRSGQRCIPSKRTTLSSVLSAEPNLLKTRSGNQMQWCQICFHQNATFYGCTREFAPKNRWSILRMQCICTSLTWPMQWIHLGTQLICGILGIAYWVGIAYWLLHIACIYSGAHCVHASDSVHHKLGHWSRPVIGGIIYLLNPVLLAEL